MARKAAVLFCSQETLLAARLANPGFGIVFRDGMVEHDPVPWRGATADGICHYGAYRSSPIGFRSFTTVPAPNPPNPADTVLHSPEGCAP